jgi:hypothetical protein
MWGLRSPAPIELPFPSIQGEPFTHIGVVERKLGAAAAHGFWFGGGGCFVLRRPTPLFCCTLLRAPAALALCTHTQLNASSPQMMFGSFYRYTLRIFGLRAGVEVFPSGDEMVWGKKTRVLRVFVL